MQPDSLERGELSQPEPAQGFSPDVYTIHAGRRECRICLVGEENERDKSLVQPCGCRGSCSWTHRHCLERWVKESKNRTCEICKTDFKAELIQNIPVSEPAALQEVYRATERQTETGRTLREWTPLILTVLAILAVVIFVALIGMNASDHKWAGILLRVLAFSIPTLLIVRLVWVYCRARSSG
jgi:E3 ubiquitin-protein ligase DOA10